MGLKIRYHFTKFDGLGWTWELKVLQTKKNHYIEKRAEKMASFFEKLNLVLYIDHYKY